MRLHHLFLDTCAPPEPPTLSLHDALPIYPPSASRTHGASPQLRRRPVGVRAADCIDVPSGIPMQTAAPTPTGDRKSTHLNSSHVATSNAHFCLTKKTQDGRSTITHRI